MKKTSILTATTVLAALFAGAVFFNSCTKQENAAKEPGQQTQQPEMTQEDVATYNKIMGFKTKVDYIKENPMYKSGEEMSVDSAVWYLDAAVNFTYSFVFESFNGLYTDSVFVEVPVSGGSVSMDDISAAYFEMYDKMYLVYDAAPGTNKDLYISTTQIKEVTANTVTFKNTATFGERGVQEEKETPFMEGENYWWGEGGGICPETVDDDFDASTKLADATITYRGLYVVDQGENWRAYYTDPTIVFEGLNANYYLWENSEDPDPFDNHYDYLMFYAKVDQCPEGETMEDYLCINWEDMNWYYFGLNQIIYEIIPGNPTIYPSLADKKFTDVFMYNEKITQSVPPFGIISLSHKADITYRKRWIIMDNEPIHF